MKELDIDGTKYGLATAYGVLSQLEGGVFELIDDDTVEKVMKKQRKKQKNGASEVDASADFLDAMNGAEYKKFLAANSMNNPRMVAIALRTVDGKSIGETFDERLQYVQDELDFQAGATIANYLSDLLKLTGEGRDQSSGKSGPSTPVISPVQKAAN